MIFFQSILFASSAFAGASADERLQQIENSVNDILTSQEGRHESFDEFEDGFVKKWQKSREVISQRSAELISQIDGNMDNSINDILTSQEGRHESFDEFEDGVVKKWQKSREVISQRSAELISQIDGNIEKFLAELSREMLQLERLTAITTPAIADPALASPAPEDMPEERVARPLSSNELKPTVKDDAPKRLYPQGCVVPKHCEVCNKEMDTARETVLRCRKGNCEVAIHKTCMAAWEPRKWACGWLHEKCPYCAGRWKDVHAKRRYWIEVKE
jgi:hypothetical protein